MRPTTPRQALMDDLETVLASKVWKNDEKIWGMAGDVLNPDDSDEWEGYYKNVPTEKLESLKADIRAYIIQRLNEDEDYGLNVPIIVFERFGIKRRYC